MSTGTLESRTVRLAGVVGWVRLSFIATVLAAGLLLAAAVALAWVLGGILLDLTVPLSVPGRVAVWCGWWTAVAAACGAFLLLPAVRRPVVDSIALRIERALGGIHNRLLTVVDLARHGRSPAGFRTSDGREFRADMVERLLDQTQERLLGFRAAHVLPWRAVLRNLCLTAAGVALLYGLFLGFGERFVVALERLLRPTADIPPATWLQLASPGDIEVLAGEPFAIEGRVVRSDVDAIDLVLLDAAGRASRRPMQAQEAAAFVATLDGLDEPVRYRLEGGNTWTRTHEIRILRRPEIRAVVRRIRLPEYMRIEAPLPVADDAAQIRAPVGATVEFEAVASAEAATGSLRLFERSLQTRVVERLDERVWIEDDLPRDAVTDGPWKWTTSQAAGGLKSFTFAGPGQPLAMRTRLDRLVLPRDRLDVREFMLMARSEPADPPTRLSVLLHHDRGKTELVWGDVAGAPPVSGAMRVAAGPLPPPGEWARLTVPMKSLASLAGQAVGGLTISVDGGRMLLDRPGWLERAQESVKQPVDRPTGSISLARSPTAFSTGSNVAVSDGNATWLGGVPVATPIWTTLEFLSAQGHANLPAAPVEIVPTIDRPPTIVVETPAETITLKVADDIPLRARGFDDWGIDEVSLLAGPDADHLGQALTLPGASPTDRPPRMQSAIAAALTPEMLGIGPGRSAVWKLRIRDTKGQTTETKLFRVTVVMPPESELAKTQVPALAQARKEAEALIKEAERKADAIDEKQKAVKEALAKEQKPERRDVDDVTRKLEQEERDAEQLRKAVEKAAEQAAKSELVPEDQQRKLANIAQKAQSLEARLSGEREPDAAPEKPEQAAGRPETKPESEPKRPPERNAAAKTEADKAERVADAPRQQQVAEAAKQLAKELEAVERRLNAEGAALQLKSLATDLEQRAVKLEAPPPATDPQAQQNAREQVREVEQILGRRFPEPKSAATPEAAKPANPPENAAAKPTGPADSTAKPVPGAPQTPPPQTAAAQPAQASADSESKTTSSTPPTAAEAAAQAAAETAASTAELAAKLSGQPQQPPRSQPPAQPAASPSPTDPGAPPPVKAEAPDAAAAEPAQDLQSLLDSREVQQALAMAERAQRLQARAAADAEREQAENSRPSKDGGRQGSDGGSRRRQDVAVDDGKHDPSGRTDGGAVTGRTAIDEAAALRGLDARQRAALYKLPPRIRDPLLEGMRQRGPAAYQDVIDTYFRQLGKDIPQ